MTSTFAEIDAEIARLLELVRQLRARRNELPPANRIPRELLQEIMHRVKQDAMEENVGYGWTNVSRVCRQWREVALGYPALWTTIVAPPTSMEWIETVRNRSRSLPLSLVDISTHVPIKGTLRDKPRLVESETVGMSSLLQREMHRVQELHLAVDDHNGKIFWERLTTPAPLLEQLWLIGRGKEFPNLENNLFSAHVPRLRSLCIGRCGFTWDTPLLAETLQDLKLIIPGPRLTIELLPSFFASLPNLRNLELEWVLPNTPPVNWDTFTYGQGYIPMPSMRTLYLKDFTCKIIADFLSRIQHHDSLCLRIRPSVGEIPKFLDKVAYPVLQRNPASAYFSSGFNLRLSTYEGSGTHLNDTVSLAFSDPYDGRIFFEVGVLALSKSDLERGSVYYWRRCGRSKIDIPPALGVAWPACFGV
ncbi:hypothetical protein AX16_010446 [Volvariella volvacea WC 439]|nr:hypothetical protein AX16_010446 [Volvariella volvacea WC 439]